MTIPINKEPSEMAKATGLYERCVFCAKETDTWHEDTNNPVCYECSKGRTVSELKNWRNNGR